MTAWLLLAAMGVLPADRLAMADRLFNRGDYQSAEVEYRALEGEKSIAVDELAYRLAECARALGRADDAARRYAELVANSPDSKYAAPARLQAALAATGEERLRQLAALDSDRVAADVRAAALYHIGSEKNDAEALARCVKVEPKGRYAPYADLRRGTILTQSGDAAVRRKGVEVLLGVAFGGSPLADDAMFFAASVSYREKKYGEAGSLFRRYCRKHPDGKRAEEARTLSVWCDYMEGRYAEAAAACGEGKSDDLAYLKACCAEQAGDAEASALFRRYLDEFPKGRYRKEAGLQLARREFAEAESAGRVADAVDAARRAASAGTASDSLRLAWAFEKAGRVDEAEAEYARVAKEFPKTEQSAQAAYARAMLAARGGDWSKAELLLAEALASGKIGEQRANALYWRGVAAMRLAHEDEAAGLLGDALKAGLGLDESREARLMLAEYDLKRGRLDSATNAYARLVREGACSRMSAGRVYEVGNLLGGDDSAVCAKALTGQKSPEWRQAGWEMLGRHEESRQAFTAAIDAYRKALAEPVKTESAASASLALGRLEARAGEHDRAEATLKAAVALNAANMPARGAAYLALAENALAKGDAKSAQGYATVVTTLFADRGLVAAAERVLKEAKAGERGGK